MSISDPNQKGRISLPNAHNPLIGQITEMRGATGPTGDIPYVPKPRIDIRESPIPKVEIQQTLTTLIESWTAKIKGEGNTSIFFRSAPEIDMEEAAKHLKEAYQDIVNLTTEQTREALKLPAKKETPTSTRAKPSIPISVREAAKLLRLTHQTIQAVTILRSEQACARLKEIACNKNGAFLG
jgi:hypothetical protein